MTARVLVVDDIALNVKLLETRLAGEYFEVVTASNGPDAIAICREGGCDIVLLDVMMPGIDGVEVCRRLRAAPETAHLPIVLVTALDQPVDRVRGLESGADDFLTKPIDEVALIARVRSLVRLKYSIDELRDRAVQSAAAGVVEPPEAFSAHAPGRGRVLLVDDLPRPSQRIAEALGPHHELIVAADPGKAVEEASRGDVDLLIVSLDLEGFDALRICGQARSHERTRYLPILLIAGLDDRQRVLRGLDLGVNDYLNRPIDRNELLARARTNILQKRYADRLRATVRQSIEMALYDPLTGLNNRRFLELQLPAMIETARLRKAPLAMMVLDIDLFKQVNDSHGHDAGDQALKGFAARLQGSARGGDVVCRLGGEEFVVVMPGVTMEQASRIAERTRMAIQSQEFAIDGAGRSIPLTVSIGLAELADDCDGAGLYRRADRALYRAKSEGRNRVTEGAA